MVALNAEVPASQANYVTQLIYESDFGKPIQKQDEIVSGSRYQSGLGYDGIAEQRFHSRLLWSICLILLEAPSGENNVIE